MNKIKAFGIILTTLGIFTTACVLFATNQISPDVSSAYKMGVLIGSAVTECAIGFLLTFFSNKLS